MILADTGPLVAIIDRNDPHHARCREAVARFVAEPLVTTWPCFTEAMYLLFRSAGFPGQAELWRLLNRGALVIHVPDAAEVARKQELMTSYRDAPMDLADASVVAAAETLRSSEVFTLDQHFYAYRLPNDGTFRVLP